MNKLCVLTLALFKNLYSFPTDRKKKARQILLLFVLGLCFVPMVVNIVKFIWVMYDGLAAVGEEGILLSLGIAISAFVIFFFGLFYTLNTFYFSDDVENLLPLPVKSAHILGAKFIIVIIFEYLTEILILLPLLMVYGLKGAEGFLYYLYALLIFLTLPVVPIVLDSVVVMVIMRFTNLAKNKDAFRIISAVIATFFGVGVSTFTQRLGLNPGVEQIQLGNNSLVALTPNIFPFSKLGALGLINNASLDGLIYTCLFLAGSLLGFYIFLLLGNLLYYKGVTGVSVSSSRQKQISGEELSRQTVRSSVIKSYVLKELRILFRTPAYFINCILTNFLWPVLLFLPLLTQSKSMSGIGRLSALVQNEGTKGIVLASVFAIMLLISSSNGIASTSISREGESILFNKYIPLSYKTQIMAKLISGVVMGLVGMLLMSVAVAGLLKLSLSLLALICGTGLLAVIFSNLTGVVIDLLNPKLHWDNEQKAVKQNINVFLAMVLCAFFGGITVYAVVSLKLNAIQTAECLVVVYGILNILLYLGLMKKGSDLFRKIEY